MSIPKSENQVLQIVDISYLHESETVSIVKIDKFHYKIFLPGSVVFNKIYFTPGTAVFEEKQKDEDPGSVFEQDLKFSYPGEDDNMLSLVDDITGRPLLVIIVYQNGYQKLIGSPGNGARFIRSSKLTGKQSTHEFYFSSKQQLPAPWINELSNLLTAWDSSILKFDSSIITFDNI